MTFSKLIVNFSLRCKSMKPIFGNDNYVMNRVPKLKLVYIVANMVKPLQLKYKNYRKRGAYYVSSSD
ncbi:hypothetical protein BU593_02455 [Staphylococcus arlettae]|nr:hypothetical protein BU593_02455 [Staphylococcus arlettae]